VTHRPHPSTFTFAAVSYLNAAPLAAFLDKVEPGVEVLYGVPSQLVDHVLSGRADAAMVPVVDYFDTPGLKMIGSIGICGDGDVHSVLLKCNRPLEQVRTVAPDPTSKASNAMARILLAKHFGLTVRMGPPPAGGRADAEVVIGDRALYDPPGECGDYDLGGFWKTMTSLPFVFAVWVHLAGHPHAEDLNRIAHAARLPITQADCLDYISNAVSYDLGPREIEGMELFRTMLSDLRAAGSDRSQDAHTVEGHGQ